MSVGAIQLGYQVRLDQFEGPLALLLHLIRKEEMDIYDIQITKITKSYLDYIKKMRELDLEMAGEFVAMAATLIQIKARMLLPTYNEEGEVIETEDPRKELVQKLLEYQKYKEASAKLYDRPLQGRDYWLKGVREEVEPAEEGEIIIDEDNALYALMAMYRRAVRNMKKGVHKVGMKTQTIAERILELRDKFQDGEKTSLNKLITKDERYSDRLLITFLSLLELGKMGFVSLFQTDVYQDIHIEVKKDVDRNVVLRVEEYDSKDANAIAESLMAEPSSEELLMDAEEFEEKQQAELDEMMAATDEELDMAEAADAVEVVAVEPPAAGDIEGTL